MSNGQASGDYETFADGFTGLSPEEVQPERAKHRPVGLAQGPDGALYITDDAGGRIYRLTSAGGTGSK
jgi:glucose/arabinose dehydrogenase